jgi:hypothetical protein
MQKCYPYLDERVSRSVDEAITAETSREVRKRIFKRIEQGADQIYEEDCKERDECDTLLGRVVCGCVSFCVLTGLLCDYVGKH